MNNLYFDVESSNGTGRAPYRATFYQSAEHTINRREFAARIAEERGI